MMKDLSNDDVCEIILSRGTRIVKGVNHLIQLYKKQVGNMQWHLDTNGEMVSDDERKIVKQRIKDFENHIRDLEEIFH